MWTCSACMDLAFRRQTSKILTLAMYVVNHSQHNNGDCIYRIVYSSNFTANAKAKLMKGEGDGTVNVRSLAACTKWEKEMSGRHKLQHHVFNNTDHLQILRDEAPSEYVKVLISNLNQELRMSEPVISLAP